MADKKSIFRNVNVLREINAENTTEIVDFYQPGWLSPQDVQNNFRYSGFITSLRLTIDISSISSLVSIPVDSLATDTEIATATEETFTGNAKKCLCLYARTSNTPLIKIADIYLFNQRPYYYVDLLPYLTSNGTFDIAPDTILSYQIRDAGYGLLSGEDRVILLGTVVEEAPETNLETTTIINNGTSTTSLLDLAPITDSIAALQTDIDAIQELLGA
ncbi:hypothetical protein NIES21_27240 [Anabaenopsis circularis NIES-21]|uniref:Uncharacterized protein n=1 Tax=Anabaenopsis circularis NIES-21 TaxID=1085406 RepID=A0A1Z4GHB5_9CYAN|nr:hypothetical protein NIES21_27240 [Anabaenopsis circularis NIES-21]